jgi:hypothetical protein
VTDAAVDAGPMLNEEQREIAHLPAAARTLVIAGAGTGKTHLLVARLAHLIKTREVSVGELLVLSFSRAAVSEIRRRVRFPAPVFPTTFDAFATGLLATFDSEGSWQERGYEGRIAAATQLLQGNRAAQDSIEALRHVLIDEVQDLVGERARLVAALLEAASCGFTLFGDPAQSIYGYRQADEDDDDRSDPVHEWVRQRFGSVLLERRLTHNFRALSATATSVLAFGPRLQGATPDYSTVRRDLDTFVLGLTPIADLVDAAPAIRRRDGRSTAILFRTNGQALLASKKLFDFGLAHEVQRRASDRAVPGWIAPAVAGFESPMVGKRRMIERLEPLAESAGLSADDMWHQLKLLDRRRSDDVDLRVVADRIREGAIPEELNVATRLPVVVSSIHRAKGLEFDRVFLAEPSGPRQEQSTGDEARIIYVALTRARSELYALRPPDAKGMRTLPWADGRWVREAYRGKARPLVAFELCGTDVDGTEPAGAFAMPGCDVEETQGYIRDQVSPGDPVELMLCAESKRGENAFFAVHHKGRPVGVTSRRFSELVVSVLRRSRTQRPKRITGAHVEFVDTAAGHEATGAAHGLGVSGVWSRVRVFGLGEFEN